MKWNEILKMAVAGKQHLHRTPSNTKRGRQIAAMTGRNDTKQTGPNEPRDERSSIKGAISKRDI